MGMFPSDSAKEEVQELESFHRRTAAIETIFTFAVLYVGILQIFPLNGDARYLALGPVAVLIILVLLLGGRNLWNEVWSAVGRG